MKSSRILLLLIILFPVFCKLTVAQESLPVKLGIKAAPNIGFMIPDTRGYSYDGVRGGAVLGLVSDFYFLERYAFSTGFNFSFLNGRITFPEEVIRQGDTLTGNMIRTLSFIYLEIPYMIKLQTKEFGRFSFFGQIGFTTGFRIKAKALDRFEQENAEAFDEKYDYTDETTLIREAVQIGIGTELHLDQSTRLFFGLSYSNSLNNVLTGVNQKEHINEKGYLNYAELNLGILF
jgi:hypothetical protein